MKKIVLVVLTSVLLFSCGEDKKKKTDESSRQEAEVKDNYSIVFQGIYEKDDEVSIQYKKKGGYMDYEHPIKYKIIGNPSIQSFVINFPSGDSLANLQFYLSTNKEQKEVKLKCITILNNDTEVFKGDNFLYLRYFNGNAGVMMDEVKQTLTLNFEGQFPPGFTGNDQLEEILTR